MSRRTAGGRSLATKVILSSLALIAAAVLLFGATSITGVTGVVELLQERQLASECAGVAASIRARLQSAGDMLDGIVSGSSQAADGLTSRQWIAGFEYFDRLVLLSSEGAVVSAYPRSVMTDAVPAEVLNVTSVKPVFTQTGVDAETGLPVVWAVRRLTAEDGDVVAGRVRTRFLTEVLTGNESSSRLVCVSSRQGVLASAGVEADHSPEILYTAEEGDPSVGEARLGSSGLVGRYADVVAAGALSWRVAVLQPRAQLLALASDALTPAAVAGLVVSLLAIIGAAMTATLFVEPLKELERRVQRAATGAYVRAIDTDRGDEVGRLAEAFNELTTRLNALHDVSRLLGSAARTEEVLDSILESVERIASSAEVAVFLTDAVSGHLVAERSSGGSPVRPGDRVTAESHHALWQALLADGPVSVPPPEAYLAPDRGEAIAVPLRVGAEPLGLLLLWDSHRPFRDAEIETLATFTSQASVALRNSRSFEAEYASRLEAEALREAAEHLANPGDLSVALTSVGELAGRLLGADRAVLAIGEREAFGLPEAEDAAREERLLEVASAAGGADGALVVEDVESRPLAAAYAGTGVKSLILVPLSVGDEPAGCIGFEYDRGSVWFGEARLGLANALGKQLSLALSNAYLFSQARRRASNLETIFRISQAVSSSLETKVVLDRVLDVVQKIFSADAVSLMIFDASKRMLVTRMARGMVTRDLMEMRVAPGEDVQGDVFARRRPRLLGRLERAEPGVQGRAVEAGLRSLASVPLLARGKSLGVLTMYSREPHAYRDEDVELLSTFASQAALAIDTADLYGREHRVATVLQSSIIPDQMPCVEGMTIDSVYRPAGLEAEIGGDYYDIFVVGDSVVLAMCDVCGKGVEAATKTSMVKYSVRALAASGASPAAIVSRVNALVAETGDSADIVTLIVAVLDRGRGVLTYANGGHPPGMVSSPGSREVTLLTATGPLLGALASASFEEESVAIGRGSIVTLYTDGVTEARRGNRFFGERRIRHALVAGGSAEAVNRRILSSLRRFTPGDLRDDVAILTIRIESEGTQPEMVA